MKEKKTRKVLFGRRTTDKFISTSEDIGDKVEEPAKNLLKKVLWERAKGELNAMLACCRSAPVTENCSTIEVCTRDYLTALDNLIYEQVVPIKEDDEKAKEDKTEKGLSCACGDSDGVR